MQSQLSVKGLRAATACATQLVLTVTLSSFFLAQVGGAAQPPSASAQLAAADPLAAGPLQTRVSSVNFPKPAAAADHLAAGPLQTHLSSVCTSHWDKPS